ncbi:MAG: DUF1043 family protein [Porticoccaceae bacterium]
MDTTILLTGLISLLAGLAAGLYLGRALHPKEQQRKDVEGRLKAAQDQLKDYQHEVTDHFAKTAKHLNELSHSYRALHDHFTSASTRLATPEVSRKLMDAGFGQLKEGKAAMSELPEAPKDYAPKVPGGVLSEEYGLRDDANAQDERHLKVVNGVADVSDDEDPTLKVS